MEGSGSPRLITTTDTYTANTRITHTNTQVLLLVVLFLFFFFFLRSLQSKTMSGQSGCSGTVEGSKQREPRRTE